MKKVLALVMALGVFSLTSFSQENVEANQDSATTEAVAQNDSTQAPEAVAEAETTSEEVFTPEEKGFHQVIKEKFIEGGAGFMALVLICLILGVAISIERILYLNLATTNTKKLLENIEAALEKGDEEAAKEICRNTPGPVASIFYQGLTRLADGPEMVEKTVASYGSVQMGLLEKGLTWVSLCIGLAPSLGFLGTVVGMIQAFDDIAVAGEMSPTVVAGGIKVALLTTVGGLIVAMILQVFYNYLLSKIDDLTTDMEDSSISLVDMVVKYNAKK
ncbi:MAG: MotA/TolQ/ExbB proton channel family protein [Bacteroidales bacterium]|nr:MotA/TolQ/ExbB proton channel family protein [Bacteroidales bacterium]